MESKAKNPAKTTKAAAPAKAKGGKPKGTAKDNANHIEKQVNDFLSKCIYAATDDIRDVWTGEERFPSDKYQYYDNFVAEKDKRQKLTAMFNMSTEFKQMMAHIFRKFSTELSAVDFSDDDSIDTIVAKLAEANTDCYSVTMLEAVKQSRPRFGDKLKSVVDAAEYFRSRIVGAMTQPNRVKTVAITRIAQLFYDYVKALGLFIALSVWYCHTSLNKNFLCFALASQGMDGLLIDLLQDFREVKPKASKKKAAEKEPADENEPADDELAEEEWEDEIDITI